ncbi:MAG: hypothetical protein UU47_C0020G0009 [candidate division TM6 bacterium GW2011_GWE2_41_16]|nr:MAG: hypothetical protein UU47_C0020G0009 [candidate division TM6 bacterium GW2011_GWE2_41_16]
MDFAIYVHGSVPSTQDLSVWNRNTGRSLLGLYSPTYGIRVFNFPDAAGNLAYADEAQENDIQRLKEVIEQTPKNIKNLVLHGVSRGAAIIFIKFFKS